MVVYTITTGLHQHISDTVSLAKVIFACQSQSRGEHVRMMYGMDVNRRKSRWRRSAHVQQLTFQTNALHLKYIFIMKPDETMRRVKSVALQVVWNEVCLNQNNSKSETRVVRHTCSLTVHGYISFHMQPSCSEKAVSRKVMTLPHSAWAAGAIDRWPGRLFTVKAPSIVLLHYVTFNRALAHWNYTPWYTFHTIHIHFGRRHIQLPHSYVLITLFPSVIPLVYLHNSMP